MKRKLTALVLSLCMALSLLSVSVLAAEIPGQVFKEPNGDGITPFNLQWMDVTKGIISFECEPGQFYRVEVYRDGEHIGTGGSRPFEDGMAQVSISDLLLTSGTYVFTVNHCSPPNTELDKGMMAKSEPYVFGAATAALGSPTNLRFEMAEGKVYCVWDAPVDWVAGRDTFEVTVENETTGWASTTVDVQATKDPISFEVFSDTKYGGPGVSAGTYTFTVKAISGNPSVVASNAVAVQGTATYSHPDCKIVNPGGTTTPTPAPNTAYMREQSITVDGKAVQFQAYALKDAKGNETNYVKLRDVASVLNGTAVQFYVGWNGSVNIETGKAYVSNGSEMVTPFSGDRTYTEAATPTNVNGAASQLTAIVLTDDKGAGYTYYKLRDLGTALGFQVDWTAATGITVATGGAAPAETPAAGGAAEYVAGAQVKNIETGMMRIKNYGGPSQDMYTIRFEFVSPKADTLTTVSGFGKHFPVGTAPKTLDEAKKAAEELTAFVKKQNNLFEQTGVSANKAVLSEVPNKFSAPMDILFITYNRDYEVVDFVVIRSNFKTETYLTE